MVTRTIRWGLTIAWVLCLSSCATVDPYRAPPPAQPPVAADPTAPSPDSMERRAADDEGAAAPLAPKPGPAAAYLVVEAQKLANAGDYERAAAQIERALRIERGNPWLYLALADIRYAQGAGPAARALLNRARSLSNGDPEIADKAQTLSLRDARNASPP